MKRVLCFVFLVLFSMFTFSNAATGDILFTISGAEVVLPGPDGALHAFRADGTELTDYGWPILPPEGSVFIHGPVFYGMDDNFTTEEILIFSKNIGSGAITLKAYDYSGNSVAGYSDTAVPGSVTSSPVASNLGSGKCKILYGTSDGKLNILDLFDLSHVTYDITADSDIWVQGFYASGENYILASDTSGLNRFYSIDDDTELLSEKLVPVIDLNFTDPFGSVNVSAAPSFSARGTDLYLAGVSGNSIFLIEYDLSSASSINISLSSISDIDPSAGCTIYFDNSDEANIIFADKNKNVFLCPTFDSSTTNDEIVKIVSGAKYQKDLVFSNTLDFDNNLSFQVFQGLGQNFFSPRDGYSVWHGELYREAQPRVTLLDAYPYCISPNGDHQFDYSFATLFLSYSSPIELQARILHSGTVVKEILDNYYLPLDSKLLPSVRIPFDGKDESGVKLFDGTYTLEITAKGITGLPVHETFDFYVDTSDPSVNIPEVDEGYITMRFESASVSISGSDGEGRLNYPENPFENISLRYVNKDDETLFDVRSGILLSNNSEKSFGWTGRYAENQIVLPDGEYYIETTLCDAAKNKSIQDFADSVIIVDRTPVYIEKITRSPMVTSPGEIPVITAEFSEEPYKVIAELTDREKNVIASGEYIFDKNDEVNQTEKILLSSSESIFSGFPPENWLNSLEDGLYYINIETIDIDHLVNGEEIGNLYSSSARIVKNRIPANISFPMKSIDGIVEEINDAANFAVTGTALDPDTTNDYSFSGYSVWYREGQFSSSDIGPDVQSNTLESSGWTELAVPEYNYSGSQVLPVNEGVLAYFTDSDARNPGMIYTIVLIAEDNTEKSWDHAYFMAVADPYAPTYYIAASSENPASYTIPDGDPIPAIEFEIISSDSELSDLLLLITDANGNEVRKEGYFDYSSGAFTFVWDGTNNSGNLVDSGEYTFTLFGRANTSNLVSISTETCMLTINIPEPLELLSFQTNLIPEYIADPIIKKYAFLPSERVGVNFSLNQSANVLIEMNGLEILNEYCSESEVILGTLSSGSYTIKLLAVLPGETEGIERELTFFVGNLGNTSTDYNLVTDPGYQQGAALINWYAQPSGKYLPPVKVTGAIRYEGISAKPIVMDVHSGFSQLQGTEVVQKSHYFDWIIWNTGEGYLSKTFTVSVSNVSRAITGYRIENDDTGLCTLDHYYTFENLGDRLDITVNVDISNLCLYTQGRVAIEVDEGAIETFFSKNIEDTYVYPDERHQAGEKNAYFLIPAVSSDGNMISGMPQDITNIFGKTYSNSEKTLYNHIDYHFDPSGNMKQGVYFSIQGSDTPLKGFAIESQNIMNLDLYFHENHKTFSETYSHESKSDIYRLTLNGFEKYNGYPTFIRTSEILTDSGQILSVTSPGMYIYRDSSGDLIFTCIGADADIFQGVVSYASESAVLDKSHLVPMNLTDDRITFDIKDNSAGVDDYTNHFIRIHGDISDTIICGDSDKYLGPDSDKYLESDSDECLNNGTYSYLDYEKIIFMFTGGDGTTYENTFSSDDDHIVLTPELHDLIMHFYIGTEEVTLSTAEREISYTEAFVIAPPEIGSGSVAIYYTTEDDQIHEAGTWHILFSGATVTPSLPGIPDFIARFFGNIISDKVLNLGTVQDETVFTKHSFYADYEMADGKPDPFKSGMNIWKQGAETWINVKGLNSQGYIDIPAGTEYDVYLESGIFENFIGDYIGDVVYQKYDCNLHSVDYSVLGHFYTGETSVPEIVPVAVSDIRPEWESKRIYRIENYSFNAADYLNCPDITGNLYWSGESTLECYAADESTKLGTLESDTLSSMEYGGTLYLVADNIDDDDKLYILRTEVLEPRYSIPYTKYYYDNGSQRLADAFIDPADSENNLVPDLYWDYTKSLYLDDPQSREIVPGSFVRLRNDHFRADSYRDWDYNVPEPQLTQVYSEEIPWEHPSYDLMPSQVSYNVYVIPFDPADYDGVGHNLEWMGERIWLYEFDKWDTAKEPLGDGGAEPDYPGDFEIDLDDVYTKQTYYAVSNGNRTSETLNYIMDNKITCAVYSDDLFELKRGYIDPSEIRTFTITSPSFSDIDVLGGLGAPHRFYIESDGENENFEKFYLPVRLLAIESSGDDTSLVHYKVDPGDINDLNVSTDLGVTFESWDPEIEDYPESVYTIYYSSFISIGSPLTIDGLYDCYKSVPEYVYPNGYSLIQSEMEKSYFWNDQTITVDADISDSSGIYLSEDGDGVKKVPEDSPELLGTWYIDIAMSDVTFTGIEKNWTASNDYILQGKPLTKVGASYNDDRTELPQDFLLQTSPNAFSEEDYDFYFSEGYDNSRHLTMIDYSEPTYAELFSSEDYYKRAMVWIVGGSKGVPVQNAGKLSITEDQYIETTFPIKLRGLVRIKLNIAHFLPAQKKDMFIELGNSRKYSDQNVRISVEDLPDGNYTVEFDLSQEGSCRVMIYDAGGVQVPLATPISGSVESFSFLRIGYERPDILDPEETYLIYSNNSTIELDSVEVFTYEDRYLYSMFWNDGNGEIVSNPHLEMESYDIELGYPDDSDNDVFPLENRGVIYHDLAVNDYFMPKIQPENPVPYPFVALKAIVTGEMQYGRGFIVYEKLDSGAMLQIQPSAVRKEEGRSEALANVYEKLGSHTYGLIVFDGTDIFDYEVEADIGMPYEETDELIFTSPYNLSYVSVFDADDPALSESVFSIERLDLSAISQIPSAVHRYCGAYRITPELLTTYDSYLTVRIPIEIDEYSPGMIFTPYTYNVEGKWSAGTSSVFADPENAKKCDSTSCVNVDVYSITVPLSSDEILLVPDVFPPVLQESLLFTNIPVALVNGQSMEGLLVDIYVNGVKSITVKADEETGDFQGSISLLEGENIVAAKAFFYLDASQRKESLSSNEITITYDITGPEFASRSDKRWISSIEGTECAITVSSNEAISHCIFGDLPNDIYYESTLSEGTFVHTFNWNGSDPSDGQPIPEGEHTLILNVTDLAGNSAEKNIIMGIDNTVPLSWIEFSGPYYIEQSGTVFRNEKTLFISRATDILSGIRDIEYFSNSDDIPETYEDGQYSGLPFVDLIVLNYSARDWAGNISNGSVEIINDTLPPIVQDVIHPLYVNKEDTFHITSDDQEIPELLTCSGIQTICFSIDDSQWYTVSSYDQTDLDTRYHFAHRILAFNIENYEIPTLEIKEDYPPDGMHVLSVKAIDNVENESEVKTSSFFLDSISPSISVDFTGNHFIQGDRHFISPMTQISTVIIDENTSGGDVSGVGNASYKYDDGSEIDLILDINGACQIPVEISGGSPERTITVTAIDLCGNESTFIVDVYIDDTVPVITTYFNEGTEFVGYTYLDDSTGDLYINNRIPLTIDVTDSSGISQIRYQNASDDFWSIINVSSPQSEISYEVPLIGCSEGANSYNVNASDRLGNSSDSTSIDFILDRTAPITFFIPGESMEYVQDITYPDDNELAPGMWYAPSDMTFSLAGEDYLAVDTTFSGVDKLYFVIVSSDPASGYDYWVDFDTWNETPDEIVWRALDTDEGNPYNVEDISFAPGFHTVFHKAVDRVGNMSITKSFTFIVDFLPPTIKLDFTGEFIEKDPHNYYISPETIASVEFYDDYSGIVETSVEVTNTAGTIIIEDYSNIAFSSESNVLFASASDLNGNSAQEEYNIYVDTAGPVILVDVDGQGASHVGLSQFIPIYLNFEESLSGVANIELEIAGQVVYQLDLEPFTLSYDMVFIPAASQLPDDTVQPVLTIRASDMLGNETIETAKFMIVGNMPGVNISAEPEVFSPDTETNTFTTFTCETSNTDGVASWSFSIYNESFDDSEVYKISDLGIPHAQFNWYGDRNLSEDTYLQDGKYLYKMTIYLTTGFDNGDITTPDQYITIDRNDLFTLIDASPVNISPNSDGKNDGTGFDLNFSRDNIFGDAKWKLEILSGESVYRAINGSDTPPATLFWNGRDSRGNLVEGHYDWRYSIKDYLEHTFTIDSSEQIIVDITLPSLNYQVDGTAFIYDSKFYSTPETVIHLFAADQPELSGLNFLESLISDLNNDTGNFLFTDTEDTLDVEFAELFSDWDYIFKYDAADNAYNYVSSPLYVLRLQDEAYGTIAAPAPFSPNGDGIRDTAEFIFIPNGINTPSAWSFSLGDDGIYHQSSGAGSPPQYTWDGEYSGSVLPEGDYVYDIYSEGTGVTLEDPVADSLWRSWYRGYIRIDNTSPVITLDYTLEVRPPNKVTIFDIDIVDVTGIDNWTLMVLNSSEVIVYQTSGTGDVNTVEWVHDQILLNGDYTCIFTATDLAGNSGEGTLEMPNMFMENGVYTNYDTFSPDNDGCYDVAEFYIDAEALPWTFEIRNSDSPSPQIVFSEQGTGSVSNYPIAWNGLDRTTGELCKEGVYTYLMMVDGEQISGNIYIDTTQNITTFTLDTIAMPDNHYATNPVFFNTSNSIAYLYAGGYCDCPGVNCKSPPYKISSNAEIWSINPDGSGNTKIVDAVASSWGSNSSTVNPELSFDDQYISYNRDWRIHIKELSSGSVDIIDGWVLAGDAKWSGNDTKVAFISWIDGTTLKIYDVENQTIEREIEIYAHQRSIGWSSNGMFIAVNGTPYPEDAGDPSPIYLVNLSDPLNPFRKLSSDTEWCCHPAFSPDSRKVAYLASIDDNSYCIKIVFIDENGELESYNGVESTETIQINIDDYGHGSIIGWDPDSKFIYYALGNHLIEGNDCHRSLFQIRAPYTFGTPDYYDFSIGKVDILGRNNQIIANNMEIVVNKWGVPENAFLSSDGTKIVYSEYNHLTNASDINILNLIEHSPCEGIDWNVPGSVASDDSKLIVSIDSDVLFAPDDTLTISKVTIDNLPEENNNLLHSGKIAQINDTGIKEVSTVELASASTLLSVYEIHLESQQKYFDKYIELTFLYDDSEIVGLDEDLLTVWIFDDESASWSIAQPDESLVTRDVNANSLTVKVMTIDGKFAISGYNGDGENPEILGLAISSEYFSPNGDALLDNLTISVSVSEQATVYLEIYDNNGVKAFMQNAETTGDIFVSFNWDGGSLGGIPAQDGIYTIRIYAIDAAGNISSPVETTVKLDTNPPVTQVWVDSDRVYHAADNVYCLDDASILLNAYDILSGVQYSEYSFDGYTWNAYQLPVEVASTHDGYCPLYYRSTDFAFNTESTKLLNLFIDTTPPESSGAFAPSTLIGSELHIISGSLFSISAEDGEDGCGVQYSEYRIDGDIWLNYSGPVDISILDSGTHSIEYRSYDNLDNIEFAKEIGFKIVPAMNIEMEMASIPRVLVWLNYETVPADRIAAMEDFLLSADLMTYRITDSQGGFISAMRAGMYNEYIILGNYEELEGHTSEELREHVYSGKGLITSQYYHFLGEGNDPEVLGIEFEGIYGTQDLMVNIINSPISEAGIMTASGETYRIESESTFNAGYVTVSPHLPTPAITGNIYGSGKSVYFAFDILANLEGTISILENALEYARPETHESIVPGITAIRTEITPSIIGLDIRLNEILPAGVDVINILPDGTVDGTLISWIDRLETGQSGEYYIFMNIPEFLPELTISAELSYLTNGIWWQMSPYLINVEIAYPDGMSAMREDALALLNDLSVDRKEEHLVENALKSLDKLQETVVSSEDKEKNILEILKAINSIREITSADTGGILDIMGTILLYYEALPLEVAR
ncbi:hypothetical protein KAU32_13225 [bacterium]|nr:hypothetical protein [bacterium]